MKDIDTICQRIVKVLFLEEQAYTHEVVWDDWHRKVIANITKGMDPYDRRQLYLDVLYEIDSVKIELNSKQKQAIKRLIFPRGKLKREQDEELRILNKGF